MVQYRKNVSGTYTTADHPANTGLTTKYSNTNGNDYITTALMDVPISTNNAYVKNSYPAVHTLTLKKALNGTDNVSGVDDDTPFYFEIALSNLPTGVDLQYSSGSDTITNYPIIAKNGDGTTATYDYTTNKVVVFASKNHSATIEGIPHGTTYTVTEKYKNASNDYVAISNDPNHPHVDYGTAGATSISEALNADAEATVTNSYRQITLTKTDAANDASYNYKVNGATYYLLKLKPAAFNNGIIVDGFKTPYEASASTIETLRALTDYCEVVKKPDGTTDWTDTTNSDGQIVVKDGDVYGGLADGTYIFYESAAPSNYTRDNTYSDDKLVTIVTSGDTYAYSTAVNATTHKAAYENTRSTGSLMLLKSLANGTTTNGDFTFHVVLNRPDGDTSFDLTKYMTRVVTGEGANATYTLNGISVQNLTDANFTASKIEFDVTVANGDTGVTIPNIPFGTTYVVTETLSEAQTTAGWKQVGTTSYSDSSNQKIDTLAADSIDTATITNMRTGSLKLKKTLANGSNGQTNNALTYGGVEFIYQVVLTAPDNLNDLSDYYNATAITLPTGKEYTDATHTRVLNTQARTYTLYAKVTANDTDGISISGIPDGTTYVVSEVAALMLSDWVQIGSVAYTDSANKKIGNTIADEATSTNALTSSLQITKTTTVDTGNVPAGTFGFKVTLTPPQDVDLSSVKMSVAGGEASAVTFTSNAIEFTITVSSNSTTSNSNYVTFTGIPLGTTYTVEETTMPQTGSPAAADTHWKLKTIAGGTTDLTAKTSSDSISADQSTANFTNTYTHYASLGIQKAIDASLRGKQIAGANSGDVIAASSDTHAFPIWVTLTAPSGHTWSEYEAPEVSGGEITNSSDTVKIIKMTITEAASKTISNVPYGTTYTIEEKNYSVDTVEHNIPAIVGGIIVASGPYDSTNSVYTALPSGKEFTATTGTVTETVVNRFDPKGKLTVKKATAVTEGSASINPSSSENTPKYPATVTYKITLKRTDGNNWKTGDNWNIPEGMTGIPDNATVITTGDDANKVCEFTVNVNTDGTELEVLNYVPFGIIQYKVEEVENTANVSGYVCNPTGQVTTYTTINNTQAENNTDPVVEITNTYTQVGELELKKDLAGDYTAAGKAGNSTFTYHATLTAPNDKTWAQLADSGFSITAGTDAGGAVIDNVNTTNSGKTYSFDVTNVSFDGTTGNSHIKITGIPYGTTYTVTETTETITGFIHTKSGEVEAPAGEESATDKAKRTIGSTTQQTPTIINTYTQVGSLEITKTLAGNDVANSGKTDDSPFTFIVKITMASGLDKDIYINNVTPAGILNDSNYTAPTAPETLGSFTFEVTVSANNPVTIGNIPYGSAYTVVETDLDNGWTSTPFVVYNAVTVNTANETAQFTNTFARSLTLRKVDSRTQELITSSPAEFVLFRVPNSIGASDLNTAMANAQNEADRLTALKTYISSHSGACYPSTGTFSTVSGQLTLTESDVGGSFGTDNFYFFEVSAPTGYLPDNTATGRIFRFESGEADKVVSFPNGVQPTDVTVEKQDDNENGLGDAELDLYYQENIVPSTYNINTPVTEPAPIPDRQITTNNPTVPNVDGSTTKTTFEYQYSGVTNKPDAEENAWILPRTDNDYIYFRDFNIGTTAEWDDVENGAKNQRYWLKTTLGYNDYGQNQEINYNHDYWFAAKFYNNNGDVRYAMWERFVDKYTYDGVTYDTIVWKIQPPDGYNKVRFCLYKGDNCVRNTQEIIFQLGKVYTKNGWGTEYKEEYGNKCYYNVPLDDGKNWSTYYTNPHTNGAMDKRNTATTELYQADRYEATPQKVVFHCNSNQVWHNIHIEFFDENQQPIGQKFPGYMMEPYAKADHDTYRINGYLSYELTIPEGARYFRVNNGVAFDKTYGYHTEIKALYTGTETVEGKLASKYKNYHNYFHLGTSSSDRPGGVNVNNVTDTPLVTWSNNFIKNYPVNDNLYEQFDNTHEIEADGDYVYFALPKTGSGTGSDWKKNHVYAYFYGGGNLRQDNWQRACYSIWPGVAPVSTEYTTYPAGSTTGTDTHSDIYKYSYGGSLYGNDSASISNPETTFDYTRNGKTYIVYKFRIPLGDRTNYDFVIFNDGTANNGGGQETEVIGYSAGTLYLADRTADSHNYKQTTDLYTSNRGDYLYIRMDSTTLNNWDDLHVTFYNANGTKILQGGTGYVMKYAGVKDGYTYFKVPVPDNAKKFRLNNGYDNNAKNINKKTAQYDILTKVATAQNEGETEGGMLYTLSGTSLTLTEPTMTITEHTESQTESYPLDESSSPRGDFIYIRDDANLFGGTAPSVTFKDAAGNTITKSVNGGTATANFLTVNKHVLDSENKQWYSVGIPVEAATFTVSYGSSQTITDQPIYAKTTETVGTDDNFTTDGMYFKTTNNTPVLEILWPTFTQAEGTTNYNDDNYSDGGRGDALYIITPNRNDWTGQYVVFYNANGEEIVNTAATPTSHIGANYIGQLTLVSDGDSPVPGVSTDRAEAAGYWFRAYIPNDAKTFKVFSSDNTELGQGDIYELLTKTSRYHDDYTLGDMEYRLDVTGHKLTAVYPVFTEVPPSSSQELEVSKRANEAAASQYIASPVTSEGGYHSESAMPVLYPTSSNTITYEWTERVSNLAPKYNYIMFDNTHKNWATPYVRFYNSSTGGGTRYAMTQIDTSGIWKYTVPDDDYNSVAFSSDSNGTNEITLNNQLTASNYYGKSCTYHPAYTDSTEGENWIYFVHPNGDWGNGYVYLYGDGNNGTFPGKNEEGSGNVKKLSDGSTITGNIWRFSISPSNDYTNAVFSDSQKNGDDWNDKHRAYDGNHDGTNGTNKNDGVDLKNHGKNELWRLKNNPNVSSSTKYYEAEFVDYVTHGTVTNHAAELSAPETTGSDTTTTYLYSYQPEDRYDGKITDITAKMDANNFITLVIPNSVSKPYIKFYSDANGTEANEINTATTANGKTKSNKGLLLNPVNSGTNANNMKLNTATYTCLTNTGTNNTYKVRLPKNAKSFKVFNDTTQIGSAATPLYETRNATVNETGITLTDYHNAGTTYTVDTTGSGSVTATDYRDSTLFKSPMGALEYKTDYDYIFLTDDGNTIKDSGSTVYAYFFGGKDGAYKVSGSAVVTDTDNDSWYGVSPSFTYVDNSGNTVYAFQYPTSTNGDYPYVMFNNGAYNSTVKVTEAVAYAPGTNYTLAKSGSGYITVNYGTKNAYTLTSTAGDKTSTETVRYSTTKTNGQYLIFHDNGTYDFGLLSNNRYTLDDLHITFYEDAEGGTPVGNASPGYKMDKLTQGGGSYYYYRITIPNGARYFRINNGINKTNGTTNNNYRESVIEQIAANGIYEFVSGTTDAKDIWNSDETPAAVSELNAHSYYLTLKNPLDDDEDEIPEVTRDIKLATIVTDGTTNNEGKQKYIKWLKPLPVENMPEGKEYDSDDATTYQPNTVDTNYLDHTTADINHPYNENGPMITKVKVIKKGTYYWKETVAPAGYEMNEDKHYFTVKSGGVKEPSKVIVTDTPISGEVILTKKAKEKVGNIDVGSTLAGAEFKLIKIEGSSEIDTIRFSKSSNTEINEYSASSSSAQYNAEGYWLTTDANGKLKIVGLLPGDYCLEEQKGAKGYSHLDSNVLDANNEPTKKRVYFSIGSNTKKKEIECTDEMEPAYIKLYEHISEKRDEWGDPTFVFKIKQTGYYKNDGTSDIQTIDNGKEILVALTVDDDGKYTAGLVSHTDPAYDYSQWYQEAMDETETVNEHNVLEYEGLFNIDAQGRIRVEPGTYDITRLPVSRYEFVENTWKLADENENVFETNRQESTEKCTVTVPATKTALVHYYDKVGYYDKFTQVDEEINAFHRYTDASDNTVKKAVKGIRIEDYHVDTNDNTENHDTLSSDTLTVNVTSSPRFKAYFICADGSERQLTASELAKLNITYTYDAESGDKVSFGNNGDNNDFSYDTATDVITVDNYAANYIQGVYTLTATYVEDNTDKYSADFDIVFERTAPSNP